VILALTPYGLGWTEPTSLYHHAAWFWTAAELVTLVLIMLIYGSGRRWYWHHRYLYYRLLSEQFRSLRFLMCLGRSLPEATLRGHWLRTDVQQSWVGHHFHVVAADAGMVTARLDPDHLTACRALIHQALLVGHEAHASDAGTGVKGQIGFHRDIANELEA